MSDKFSSKLSKLIPLRKKISNWCLAATIFCFVMTFLTSINSPFLSLTIVFVFASAALNPDRRSCYFDSNRSPKSRSILDPVNPASPNNPANPFHW